MRAIYFCESGYDFYKVYYDDVRRRLAAEFELTDKIYCRADLGREDFSGAEIIFTTWGMAKLSEEEIETFLPNLKAVFYAAGSVQRFAKEFLNKGVRIFSAWKANALPVAEYSFAQIILANKGFYHASRQAKTDYTAARETVLNYKGNYAAKIGILGDGAIGFEVIKRLLTLNLDIYVYSVTMSAQQAQNLGVRLAPLKEIFSECDVISNHLADNADTKNIISKQLIDSLKSYSTFINTGRGAQVDENALIEKLKKDPTVTAVLDVTKIEPPENESGLYSLPNAVLTPHIAGSLGCEVRRMADFMEQESLSYKNGADCKHEVTLSMLQTMA